MNNKLQKKKNDCKSKCTKFIRAKNLCEAIDKLANRKTAMELPEETEIETWMNLLKKRKGTCFFFKPKF